MYFATSSTVKFMKFLSFLFVLSIFLSHLLLAIEKWSIPILLYPSNRAQTTASSTSFLFSKGQRGVREKEVLCWTHWLSLPQKQPVAQHNCSRIQPRYNKGISHIFSDILFLAPEMDVA